MGKLLNKFIILCIFAFLPILAISFFACGLSVVADEVGALDETATELSDFNSFNYDGNYYLNDDIQSDILRDGIFTGMLDGKGHTITLNSDAFLTPYDNMGLFAKTDGATIKNLSIIVPSTEITASINESIDSVINVGALVGDAKNSVFENVKVIINDNNYIKLSNTFINVNFGGLCGSASACRIKNCYTEINLELKQFSVSNVMDNIGGLCGHSYNCEIYNSYSKSGINFTTDRTNITNNLGGICGLLKGSESKIINCFFLGNISKFNNNLFKSANNNAGAIVGKLASGVLSPNIRNINYNAFASDLNSGISAISDCGNYDMSLCTFTSAVLTSFNKKEMFKNSNIFDINYAYDFDETWCFEDNSYPVLQVFCSFNYKVSVPYINKDSVIKKIDDNNGDFAFTSPGFLLNKDNFGYTAFDIESKYYNIVNWLLNDKVLEIDDNYYSLSEDKNTLTINKICDKTAGVYSIELTPVKVLLEIVCFDNDVSEVSESCGNVQVNDSTKTHTIEYLTFFNRELKLSAYNGNHYAFLGWYSKPGTLLTSTKSLDRFILGESFRQGSGTSISLDYLAAVPEDPEAEDELEYKYSTKIYAYFTTQKVVLSFKKVINGVVSEIKSDENVPSGKEYDSNITFNSDDFAQYDFDGWYTDEDFVYKVSDEQNLVVSPEFDTTYYAKWTLKESKKSGANGKLVGIIVGSILGGAGLITGLVIWIIYKKKQNAYKKNFSI